MKNEPYRLGFLVGAMDGEAGLAIASSINRFYTAGRYDADLLMFYREMSYVKKVLMFAAMNATESYDFSGDVIATDLVSASNLLRCPGPRRRYFYVGDAEWTRHRLSMTYLDFVNVYRSPLLQIVVPTTEMARVVETTWNRQVFKVVGLADMNNLVKELGGVAL